MAVSLEQPVAVVPRDVTETARSCASSPRDLALSAAFDLTGTSVIREGARVLVGLSRTGEAGVLAARAARALRLGESGQAVYDARMGYATLRGASGYASMAVGAAQSGFAGVNAVQTLRQAGPFLINAAKLLPFGIGTAVTGAQAFVDCVVQPLSAGGR